MTVRGAAGARILVGQFFLEANSFASGSTTLADFEPAGLYVGDELRRERLPEGGELAAAWDILAARGAVIVPAIRAFAAARPPMAPQAWATISDAIVSRAAGDIDGVYLALHGAALAHGVDDPEGELLQALRGRLRPGVPIAVSLDCHAGWTPAMEAGCDIATAYRTVPHTDLIRTGSQAAGLLVRALEGEIRPVIRSARLAMIGPADRQDSGDPRFAGLMGLASDAEARDGILAAAVLPSHPWRDVPELGWGVIVTTDDDAALAASTAAAIADALWDERRWFIGGRRPGIADALERALEGPAPVIVADSGDSPTGGALGDSTELLRVALAHRDRGIWLALTDAAAAKEAHRAGIGSAIALEVGSGGAGAYNERTLIEATVAALPDGALTYSGPFARGVTDDMGRSAVLAMDAIRVVLHSRPVMEIDPSPYVAAGLDPSHAEVLQAKSHVSFRAGYAHLTDRAVVADTPGPTMADLTRMPYVRRPRPLFPFEDPSERDPEARA
jgi:microcystin degradation protein MlrC